MRQSRYFSEAQQARIQRELAGQDKPIAPNTDGFISLKEAAWIISTSIGQAMSKLPVSRLPKTKVRQQVVGRSPWLYRREHIERIAKVKKVTGISLAAAVAVVVGEIEGKL